jgi:NAD+ synthase (glutamine-hydrolysing)
MRIFMAQINTVVGDFAGNAEQVLASVRTACEQVADPVVVFPELTLSGYPPEDLLLRPSLSRRVETCLAGLLESLPRAAWVILGYPVERDASLYNCAGVLHAGSLVAEYRKRELPNYQVFDEKRYFTPGSEACIVEVQGRRLGLTICEDIWVREPAAAAAAAGAELLINLNASPFHRGKQDQRLALVAQRARDHGMPIVYVNQVGGQDELVFDGGSFAVDAAANVVALAPRFETALQSLQVSGPPQAPALGDGTIAESLDELAATWQALVLGVRDYVNKNGFPGVVLGLSGGVDSALTLAVAVDALGPERVEAVMMPFRYTSDMSIADAAEQSDTLGVRHSVISIEPMYEAFMDGACAGVCRPGAGYHGGKPAGALPRRAADVDLEQEGLAGADHRQQERARGRLLHPVRRYGRRL